MGTTINININDGSSSLVEKNKVDIQANREKNRTEAYQREAAEEAAKKEEKSKTSYYKNSTDFVTKPYERERPEQEPAAWGHVKQPVGIGFVSRNYHYDDSLTFQYEDLTVYSGNGTASISFSLLASEFINFDLKYGHTLLNQTASSGANLSTDWPPGAPPGCGSPPSISNIVISRIEYTERVINGIYSIEYGDELSPCYDFYIDKTINTGFASSTISDFRFYSDGLELVLPVKENLFIYYRMGYTKRYGIYSGGYVTEEYGIEKPNSYTCYTPGVNGDWSRTERTYATLYRKYSFDDTFIEQESTFQKYEKCVLVGSNNVKEIPVPPQLSSRIDELFLGRTNSYPPGISETAAAFQSQSDITYNKITSDLCVITDADYDVTITKNVNLKLKQFENSAVYSNRLNNEFKIRPQVDLSYALSYGLVCIDNTGEIDLVNQYTSVNYIPIIGGTLAAYSILRSGQPERHRTERDPDIMDEYNSPLFISGSICAASLRPKKVINITADFENGQLTSDHYFGYTDAAPWFVNSPDINTIPDNITFKTNYAYIEPSNYGTIASQLGVNNILISWDYGEPGKCSSELTALGFNVSELSFN